MGDANLLRTLREYSKPSHEGYMNTIELPVRNNVVPLRSDTIRLVQNICSFHKLWFKFPNQHLKDFLKLVDSLDLDGSIITWEDLTTRFLAQFFPPRRTAKLYNDILIFQQHQRESLSEAWTRFKDLIQKKAVSQKLDDTPIRDTLGNLAAQMNFTSTNDPMREDIREQNRNPSSPKHVHFVNSIVILNKEDETKEEGNVNTITTEYEDHEMTVKSEDFGEETEDEIE
nr:hypothetical protein [Tanacetum cinerariifolium]